MVTVANRNSTLKVRKSFGERLSAPPHIAFLRLACEASF